MASIRKNLPTTQDPNSRITSVKAAQKFFSEDRERSFEAKMTEDSVRLLTLQQQLEKEADGKVAFFGLSVNDTIKTCLANNMGKKAEKVKSDFKVPDKRCVRSTLVTLHTKPYTASSTDTGTSSSMP